MKNTLLALALFATSATVFAHTGPGKPAAKKDNCTGMAATQCTKGMATGNMAGMPACCRAKMAAAKTAGAPAASKPMAKTM
ncbi:hypothetical protein [Hymenobacter coccineus]|uniref:Phosphate starvation-inducible protein PsiF n=1 Tax=Hymenobacter coccineus TaxID=1908235 RepID=A0A1G1SQZ8_9BACT|nr:hypothetical protein [Hymenobacter coccineus]OGX81056.1 hypothetical protein BEN49_16315 [Hymenobacter coccineus]